MQVLELVIFAALAAVVLFQLYAVLGRRVGRQPEDTAEAEAARTPKPEIEPRRPDEVEVVEGPPLTGIAALKDRDPAFEVTSFLRGAKTAYEMVVLAYAKGDREALRNLTSDSVYQTFDKAISERDADGRTETVEFLQPPRADLESAEMSGNLARVRVRFLAEFRTRSKGSEGEAVDDRRTAEVWTFERLVDSRDPNWALARVDAAEA